jgi:hypothetical protein
VAPDPGDDSGCGGGHGEELRALIERVSRPIAMEVCREKILKVFDVDVHSAGDLRDQHAKNLAVSAMLKRDEIGNSAAIQSRMNFRFILAGFFLSPIATAIVIFVMNKLMK